jgi:hypothetical protein
MGTECAPVRLAELVKTGGQIVIATLYRIATNLT